jgi:hypothetical protein
METSLAPIALFVYNRKQHTEKTVEALRKNTLASQSDLFIFSDGKKGDDSSNRVTEVREYLKTISGFKSVTIKESETNKGLAKSIIAGVTEIVNHFGKIIVVEDDLVTSPYFLSYMNQGLDMYENENNVASIHGYVYPIKQEYVEKLPETFFIRGADCWGWATWKRAWNIFEPEGQKLLDEIKKQKLEEEFNFNNTFDYTGMLKAQTEGKNNSWAIRWYASAFLANKLTLYPKESLVTNIGFDGSGTHDKVGGKNIFGDSVSDTEIKIKPIVIQESEIGRQAFAKYFKSNRPSIFRRSWSKRPPVRVHLKKIKWLRKLVMQLRVVWNYISSPKNTPLDKKEPWIVRGAIDWMKTYLDKNMAVFEWGSGGSTVFMSLRTKQVISIEHNYEWFLKTNLYLKLNGLSNCQYRFVEAENGNNPNYASTDKNYLKHNFKKYCEMIDTFPNNHFDLVFIDGRARSSCIVQAKNKVKVGGYILLDNSEREEYQIGINLLNGWGRTDFKDSDSTTSIFQKK